MYDYDPDPSNTQELGFSKGDFFHVVSRENDTDWYEACNPLIPNARGLVPVSYFEIIGKTERESAGSAASGASNIIPLHDSGYSEKSSHSRQGSTAGAPPRGHTRMSSMGRSSRSMVYGLVQYDFAAERPDELTAKAGEYIIVVAQSNPEWFVAKPIGRLGGPGLIPVSFIEIKDMSTGQTVTDVQGAITRAQVPKVEEWKRIVSDYKGSSIPLGKFEVANGASAQREMERMSLSNASQHQSINGLSSVRWASYVKDVTALMVGRIRIRINRSNNAMAIRRPKAHTIDTPSGICMLPSLHRYHDTVSKTISIGISSSVSLKMDGIGSCPGITRTFTISRLRFFRNSRKRPTPMAAPESFLTCRGR